MARRAASPAVGLKADAGRDGIVAAFIGGERSKARPNRTMRAWSDGGCGAGSGSNQAFPRAWSDGSCGDLIKARGLDFAAGHA
jgi:hypothetical protein